MRPLDHAPVRLVKTVQDDRLGGTVDWMALAAEQARKSLHEGGIPIGAVLVCDNKLLGQGYNRRVQKGSAILHAEMGALEHAGRLPAGIYCRCTLYATPSPCPMCAGAILLYKTVKSRICCKFDSVNPFFASC